VERPGFQKSASSPFLSGKGPLLALWRPISSRMTERVPDIERGGATPQGDCRVFQKNSVALAGSVEYFRIPRVFLRCASGADLYALRDGKSMQRHSSRGGRDSPLWRFPKLGRYRPRSTSTKCCASACFRSDEPCGGELRRSRGQVSKTKRDCSSRTSCGFLGKEAGGADSGAGLCYVAARSGVVSAPRKLSPPAFWWRGA